MTAGWVPIFDDSFQRVPVNNYDAVYADGFRVMAGYVAGGSSDKWVTAGEIRMWLATGSDTGFLPLFEAKGDEPVTSPNSGGVHARAARAGCRVRSVPDTCVISPAMDRNITMAQAQGPVAQYMSAWKRADTKPPLPYVELDAGAYLFRAGDTVGTGTPAAYSWDPGGNLITPDNAPSHVLWTQEHNGKALHGGVVDIGHVRLTAPIYWSRSMTTAPLDAADVATILHTDGIIPNIDLLAYRPDSPAHSPAGTNKFVAWQTLVIETAADAHFARVAAEAALAQSKANAVAIAKIPTTSLPPGPMLQSDVDRIAAAVLAGITLVQKTP